MSTQAKSSQNGIWGIQIDQWVQSTGVKMDHGRLVVTRSVSSDGTARLWQWDAEIILAPVKTGYHVHYAVIYSPDATMITSTGRYKDSEHSVLSE
jgi:hypothetical protein